MTENIQDNQESKAKMLPTKLNTSFDEWCKLLIAEIKHRKIDASKVTKLDAKHAWEFENTPASFAVQLQYMNERKLRALDTKTLKVF